MKPLQGISLAVLSAAPAARVSARHLTRLGAEIGADPAAADVVLCDTQDVPATGIRCVFERHALDCGGLVDSEATAQAVAGLTDYVGPAGGTPARVGCDVGQAVAGFASVQAVLAALYRGGAPPVVHVSPLRAIMTLKTILWAARARPDVWTGTHVRSRERLVDSGYRTADGYVTLDFAPGAQQSWLHFTGALELEAETIAALRPRWYETVGWGDDVDVARPIYEARLATLTSEQAVQLIRQSGGSSVPFLSPAQCLAHPQARAVGLPRSLEDGLPWRMTAEPGAAPPRGGVDPTDGPPLAGVRVIDLGVGGVGPFAATLLAWLGADVVKIEAPNEFIMTVRPTAGDISTTYLALNQGKRSVTLDLKRADDLALARELVAGADVVLENFRPGALDRLGLGFEHLRTLNPAIIYCSATGFGWDGPLAKEPCTDPHMQAFSGFAALSAQPPDGAPRRIRYYGFVDLVTSMVIVEAACAALVLRDRQGGAVRMQTSMLHAVTEVQSLNAESDRPAPDDVFRAGDGFIAITCRDDDQWQTLLDVLGRPAALTGSALNTRRGRFQNAERLRSALSTILAERPAAAWALELGRVGISAARALHDDDVIARRELWRWQMLRDLPLEHAGPLIAGGPPWRLPTAEHPPKAPRPGSATRSLRADPHAFWTAPRGSPARPPTKDPVSLCRAMA